MRDLRALRRCPETFPSVGSTQLGRHRREALDSLEREARERALSGVRLRVWLFRIRATLGSDDAIELLLRLADRRP